MPKHCHVFSQLDGLGQMCELGAINVRTCNDIRISLSCTDERKLNPSYFPPRPVSTYMPDQCLTTSSLAHIRIAL